MKKPLLLLLLPVFVHAQKWQYLSTAQGDIPQPWTSTQQTAALVMDVDVDGVDDFVMACRQKAPALIWYSLKKGQWIRRVIDTAFLTIEAGGAAADLDGDGDLDIGMGGDWQSPKVWWWENPAPHFDQIWKRHEIKSEGKPMHHDQIFGDFRQNGSIQMAFWNQTIKSVFIADMPKDGPKGQWSLDKIFTGEAGEKKSWYAEGITAADVDGDGWRDILAGNYWFKLKDEQFKAIRFGEEGGRVCTGKFRAGKTRQIVISPGDGTGRLLYYDCIGDKDPSVSEHWKARDLIGRELIHGHTLEIADINNDGHLDIFCAEMAQWTEKPDVVDNPNAEAFILYGDGNGHFEKTVFKKGFDFHEARLVDIDGDGDIDVVSKPYTWKAPRLDVWLQNGSGKQMPSLQTIAQRYGLQLYSLRDYFKKDVPATAAFVKDLGIKEVELAGTYGWKPAQFNALLLKNGLVPKSALFGFDEVRDKMDSLIRLAKIFKLDCIGVAWIPHKSGKFNREDTDKAISVFNEAGKKAAKAGLRFIYHPHGYEFIPVEWGGTLYDYMVKNTDPKTVFFEIDCFWAFHGGEDPSLLMHRYKGRIIALHLKDMIFGQETGVYTGGAPLTSDVVIGTGQMDFRKILKTAAQTGVRYFFIEDENADVKAHLSLTLKYLRGLK